jgi:hypothetical protein
MGKRLLKFERPAEIPMFPYEIAKPSGHTYHCCVLGRLLLLQSLVQQQIEQPVVTELLMY